MYPVPSVKHAVRTSQRGERALGAPSLCRHRILRDGVREAWQALRSAQRSHLLPV
jgi:hypothetical protein